ncbi:MAG: tyrosine-type recombinase/integrase, partial [Patescibacteria group bacterium]
RKRHKPPIGLGGFCVLMTIAEAAKSFTDWRGFKSNPRTINGYVRDLTHFCIYLRDPFMDVEAITMEECIDWLKLLQILGYDQNSLQKKAIALKLFFEYLEKRKLNVVQSDLIPIPRKEFRFPRVAEEADYQQLIAAIPEGKGKYRLRHWEIRDKALIMMLYDTGARNGEIASLDLDDLDLEKKSARIKTEKSRGTIPFREIFWTEGTDRVLKKWIEARKELESRYQDFDKNALFVGVKCGYARGKRMPVNYLSEIVRKWSNKAGLKIALNPHAFRHKFGRDLAKKGANAFVISSLLGHAQVSSSYPLYHAFWKRQGIYVSQI